MATRTVIPAGVRALFRDLKNGPLGHTPMRQSAQRALIRAIAPPLGRLYEAMSFRAGNLLVC